MTTLIAVYNSEGCQGRCDAADLATIAAHAAGGPYAYLTLAGLSAITGARVVHRYRRASGRRPRARRYAYGTWLTATAATLTGTYAGVASGAGQGVMLAGGMVVAAPYLWRHRRRPPAVIPKAEPPALPPGPDPRVEAFLARFGGEQWCRDAQCHSVSDVTDGFTFEITLAPEGKGTTATVIGQIPQIAALYDVPADQVTVEHGPKRSERRARITVLTAEAAHEREEPWDGRSTYNPQTGCVDLGRFADGATAHWMLHKPRSGAASGVLAGVIGSGKTGTGHVIACETGLAKVCAECLGAGTCTQCVLRRIAGLWIGDPQRQPFGVWRGRADLTAWGPYASVRMLLWVHAAMWSRAAYLGNLVWIDHLGRDNVGKGWFDPEPSLPLLTCIIDEWPMIVAIPELAKIAIPLAAEIVKEGRKVGISLILLTQIPDLPQLGERAVREMLKAFNVIAHRTDGLSKTMLGIQGDPTKLPAGVHGLGYISGYDKRPGATFRTKHLREHLLLGETGIDVREIAEWIGREPIEFDEGIMAPLRPLGYTGHGQVIEDGDLDSLLDVLPVATAAPAGVATLTAPAPVQQATMPVYMPLLAVVLSERGEMDLWDVSEAAGVNALEADQALATLASAGVAVQVSPGRFRWTGARP